MIINSEKIKFITLRFESWDELNNLNCALNAAMNAEETINYLEVEHDFTPEDFLKVKQTRNHISNFLENEA
jgi:hypothetical protein